MNQQYFLRWNNHQPNFISVFSNLLSNESLVDVTLAAEGKHIQAHKVVLSACSNYFQSLFSINPCRHPIVILKDISYNDLKHIVDFIYYGEVSVTEEQLSSVIKAAESLQIKGLANIQELNSSNAENTNYIRRKRVRKSSTGSECTVTDSFEDVEVVVPSTISPGNSSLGTASATTVIASSSATSSYSPGNIAPIIKQSSEGIENGAITCKREQGRSGIQQADGWTILNETSVVLNTSQSSLCPSNQLFPSTTSSYVECKSYKRNYTIRGNENFEQAIEEVRMGRMGFCKAARVYGVNNRTLWLEYKKRGYKCRTPSKMKHKQTLQTTTTTDNNNMTTQVVNTQCVSRTTDITTFQQYQPTVPLQTAHVYPVTDNINNCFNDSRFIHPHTSAG